MELTPQPVVDPAVLGGHHQPRGAPVQPVDRVEGEAGPQIMSQAVGQGRLPGIQGGGDHRQRGALVDHQQVLVLIGNVQLHGDRLHGRGPLGSPQIHRQPVAGTYHGAGEHPRPIESQAALRPLQPADQGRRESQFPAQQGSDVPPVLLRRYHQLQSGHDTPPMQQNLNLLYNSPQMFSISKIV